MGEALDNTSVRELQQKIHNLRNQVTISCVALDVFSSCETLREEIKEKDCHIHKQHATIGEIKERTRSEIKFIKEEIKKTSPLCKVRNLKEEIKEKDRHINKQTNKQTKTIIEEINTKQISID
jgi:hypothetical protein